MEINLASCLASCAVLCSIYVQMQVFHLLSAVQPVFVPPGTAAQEAIKIITKQFVPFNNTFIYNAMLQTSMTVQL